MAVRDFRDSVVRICDDEIEARRNTLAAALGLQKAFRDYDDEDSAGLGVGVWTTVFHKNSAKGDTVEGFSAFYAGTWWQEPEEGIVALVDVGLSFDESNIPRSWRSRACAKLEHALRAVAADHVVHDGDAVSIVRPLTFAVTVASLREAIGATVDLFLKSLPPDGGLQTLFSDL